MEHTRIRIGDFTYYSGLDHLAGASEDETVAWFRKRFEKVVARPLREVRSLGRDNEAIWDLNLCVVTIICCAIEALGSFYQPNARDSVAFSHFVRAFMDPKHRERAAADGRTYAKILYGQFRCGLAHGFSIEGHEVATRPDEYIVEDHGSVSIDLWTLFEDLERAFDRYLARVDSHKRVRQKFLERFDELFVDPYPQTEA